MVQYSLALILEEKAWKFVDIEEKAWKHWKGTMRSGAKQRFLDAGKALAELKIGTELEKISMIEGKRFMPI